jgi:hypothetical protein
VGRAITGRRNDVNIQSKMQLEYSELTFGGNGKRGSKEIMTILSDKR